MAKIVLADDSKLARMQATGILRKAGYEVVEAKNGREAVELIEKHNPDFVLLDILMPEMDGAEVVDWMIDKGIKIPYVVLSADIQFSTKEEFLEKGAIAVINKPPKEIELLRVIRENLVS